MINLLKKMFSIALCAALVGGAGVALPAVAPDSGFTANAADTITYGDYEYQVNEDETVSIVRYTGSASRLAIPTSINGKKVTSIGEYAFYNCTGLTSVTIGNSVTSIGYEAFCNCTGLTSITIPDSVTSIGDYAFSACTSLTSVTIPDSVTSIGENAFSDCTSLTSINVDSNNSVYSSYEGVLLNKDKTELIIYPEGKKGSYSIPDSVTSIGEYAFFRCEKLTSITIPDSVTSIGEYAFYRCEKLTSITIPDSVTSIGNSAFRGCTGLTSINIPDGMTSIGEYTFYDCESLTSVTIPDGVTSIGNFAFEDCTSLTSITIPDSVTSIGEYAFEGCSSLTSVTIPDSVTSIGEYAFSGCTGLTSINIPDGMTSIGEYAFSGCTGLTSINIPDGMTSIDNWVFEYCTSLTSVTIPDSVTSIGKYAFSACTGLTSVTIGNSVTSIGGSAFYNCKSLTSITIPDSVTSIGEYAFSGCENLVIYGKKGSYAETYAKENSFTFIAKVFPLKNVSTIETTATVGEPITLKAKAEGGEGYYTYALMYKKSTSDTWTKIGKKYGTASTGSFTPGKAVKYDVMINVKDATGKVKSKTFTVDVKAQLKNKTTINAETVKVGEKIVLKGAASGGAKGYKYAFYYKKSKNSTWTEMKPAYTTKSAAFKPGSATSYDVKSVVMDADGRKTEKTFTVNVTK